VAAALAHKGAKVVRMSAQRLGVIPSGVGWLTLPRNPHLIALGIAPLLSCRLTWLARGEEARPARTKCWIIVLARSRTLVSIADPLTCYFKTAMTSAANTTRILHRSSSSIRNYNNTLPHSTPATTTAARGGHETGDTLTAAHLPDVTEIGISKSSGDQGASDIPRSGTAAAAVKVDSLTKSKSRAHSRLASLGRIRSRGSIHNTALARPAAASELPAHRGETLPTHHAVPVSPSDASSHKRSDTSTLSNSSSETALSDDNKSEDIKSFDDSPPKPSLSGHPTQYLANPVQEYDDSADFEEYTRILQNRPRMMHQTSSRLLRMTADDRPFTRVCTSSLHCLQSLCSRRASVSWVIRHVSYAFTFANGFSLLIGNETIFVMRPFQPALLSRHS
jgi:hypothetical protein